MKLLYVSVQGLDLFPEGLELDFIARQRVTDSNNKSLSHLFGTVYKQDVLGIIGINASRKTTTLRWLAFLLDFYLNAGKVNSEEYKSLLQG